MLAVLATAARLIRCLMADWGKELYTLLPFRAPGQTLTFDIRVMSHLWERLEHPNASFKIWTPRCRSMRKEEKVSHHGLHLLKAVKT